MKFRPFTMERWQSTYENVVDYNLSESGVHPLTLGELRDLAAADVDETLLGYGQSNGSLELREHIARLYRGATPDHVMVTNGSAEANFVAMWHLLERGRELVVISPTYMQTPGIAASLGADVVNVPLHEDAGWQPDPDEIAAAVSERTAAIVVTNPNNPTGAVLRPDARQAIVRAADSVGAWILADEVYTGAELNGQETPSFFGEYERVMATGSLSKAYGLPGLRVGWVIAEPGVAGDLWARTDYTTISPGELTDTLARHALRPQVRPRLLARTRERLRANLEVMETWLREHGVFRWRAPDAGAICFARYDLPIDSTTLAERLRVDYSVLIVPGDHFDQGPFIRFGYGIEAEALRAALARVAAQIESLAERSPA